MRAGLKKVFNPSSELLLPYLAQILDSGNDNVLVRVGECCGIDLLSALDANSA